MERTHSTNTGSPNTGHFLDTDSALEGPWRWPRSVRARCLLSVNAFTSFIGYRIYVLDTLNLCIIKSFTYILLVYCSIVMLSTKHSINLLFFYTSIIGGSCSQIRGLRFLTARINHILIVHRNQRNQI